MVRILLADDHEIVRTGLRSYLETFDDIEVVGEAENGELAIELAMQLQPDVILMDLLMPRITGVEATRELLAKGCQSRIIALTSSVDDRQVLDAIRAGALSYLLKTSSGQELVSAIRRAARNESVLDPQVQQSLIGRLHAHENEPWETLTERELEVLRALATGKNNQEIADALHIGVKTVKTHVSSIFIKLGVQDRTQAAIYAIRNGIA